MESKEKPESFNETEKNRQSKSDLMTRWLPQGDEIAFKTACYNTLLLICVCLSILSLIAVYHLMYMFLKSMLWAVLVGSFLFPAKRKISSVLRDWLSGLQESNTPLIIGVIFLPYDWLNNISDKIWRIITSKTGIYILLAYIILVLLTYERTFPSLLELIGRGHQLFDGFLLFFSNKWFIPLMIIYTIAYIRWIYKCLQIYSDDSFQNKHLARLMSIPIWVYCLTLISMRFGPFKVFFFVACLSIVVLIAAGVISVTEEAGGNPGSTEEAELEQKPSELSREKEVATIDKVSTGDSYLKIIFLLCLLLWASKQTWILVLFLLPIAFALVKRIGIKLGIFSLINIIARSLWTRFSGKFHKIVDVTVLGSLRQFILMIFSWERKLVSLLEESMHVFSSIVVMIGLALSLLFMLLFLAFQLHKETLHLVKMGSNVLDSQHDWFASAVNFTETRLGEQELDKYVEQAYVKGRTWLAAKVRTLADSHSADRADLLEKQVKQLMDNMYSVWEKRNVVVEKQQNKHRQLITQESIFYHLQQATDFSALKEELSIILKENVDTIITIAHSLWSVLSSNMSFLMSLIGDILGLLLNFGMELFNFVLEMMVFMTMVYYLLASSRQEWLPFEWAITALPTTSTSTGHTVIEAVEHAISDVFVFTAKMATFYGLYTYFVHALFDLNIVFLPSILAALFAAIPIMPPYAVCLVGVAELWLVRSEPISTIMFILMSFVPQFFADDTFYEQIKGSHPYTTGLAIIGGMFWLGLEGAIFGPIIFCFLLVMVNVYLRIVRHPSHLRWFGVT